MRWPGDRRFSLFVTLSNARNKRAGYISISSGWTPPPRSKPAKNPSGPTPIIPVSTFRRQIQGCCSHKKFIVCDFHQLFLQWCNRANNFHTPPRVTSSADIYVDHVEGLLSWTLLLSQHTPSAGGRQALPGHCVAVLAGRPHAEARELSRWDRRGEKTPLLRRHRLERVGAQEDASKWRWKKPVGVLSYPAQ